MEMLLVSLGEKNIYARSLFLTPIVDSPPFRRHGSSGKGPIHKGTHFPSEDAGQDKHDAPWGRGAGVWLAHLQALILSSSLLSYPLLFWC